MLGNVSLQELGGEGLKPGQGLIGLRGGARRSGRPSTRQEENTISRLLPPFEHDKVEPSRWQFLGATC